MAVPNGAPALFSPSMNKYFFGSKKLAPIPPDEEPEVLGEESAPLVLLPPDFYDEEPSSSAPASPAQPSKTPTKSPWGVVASPIPKTRRKGWIFRKPIEEVILNLPIENNPALYHPRGLSNPDTKCFLNTTIQTLMALPQFNSLLKRLNRTKFDESACPVLGKLVRLHQEFEPISEASKKAILAGNAVSIPLGTALSPAFCYELLKTFNPIAGTWQEDMQEFLCFMIDRAHTELLNILALVEDPDKVKEEQALHAADEWSSVGRNGKAAVIVTDVSKFKHSPVSRIFGGEMQSLVRRRNAKSSISLEPFFCLHLEVADHSISTLEDALSAHFVSETLEDAMGIVKGNAMKSLPPVLLIHLKRFAFIDGKSQKITKPIFYPEHLSIRNSWVGSSFTTGRDFRLHSVTQHLGPRAAGGHYTCYVRHGNGDWLLYDDTRVTKVDLTEVLENANGYVLCYVRG